MHRKPEQGPRILFFSGGSAIRRLSRRLIRYTHNSIHIITPFDSGGSSATLRHAFGMPAVGDLRNRLLALADPSSEGHPGMCRLATYRFDHSGSPDQLRGFLEAMCLAQDARVSRLPSPQKILACLNLRAFKDAMPEDFDLRGASIGNLIITGSWLRHGRQLDPALREFTRMIGARGTVRPVVEGDFHLAAALEDGSIVRCQHRITGNEAGSIASPIRTIWITDDRQGGSAIHPTIDDATSDLIAGADLICYPPGSFYTSVLVNLLPKGVSTAIARAPCHKVYLPALGHDSEALGLGVFDAATRLVQTLEDGLQTHVHPSRLLDRVIVDTTRGEYAAPVRAEPFQRLGIGLIDIPLLSDDSAPLIDERLAIDGLLSLI
ncbi:MAG: GAK system CofD-like protein [Gammaproteobacteria bacterium]|nr:GAK system CofD-like protein [Gammaproteobacteria bacterium]